MAGLTKPHLFLFLLARALAKATTVVGLFLAVTSHTWKVELSCVHTKQIHNHWQHIKRMGRQILSKVMVCTGLLVTGPRLDAAGGSLSFHSFFLHLRQLE